MPAQQLTKVPTQTGIRGRVGGEVPPPPLVLITLQGTPKGKGRPRFEKGAVRTPTATRNYETALKLVALRAMNGRAPLRGPLMLSVRAFFPVPASWSKKKQALALDGNVFPTGRPDFDNLLKSVDALNGVVWVDDAQVVDARVIKLYSREPRLEIAVGVRVVPPSSTGEVTALSESALQKVWDNSDDAIYDTGGGGDEVGAARHRNGLRRVPGP